MKSAIVVCFLALAAVALARPDGDKYTNKYDNVDLDSVLSNKRLLYPYVECIKGKGKCTPDAKELKSHIQEALETDCAKCTKAQRDGSERVIGHLIKHEPEVWAELKAKFDPTGQYSKNHEAKLKAVVA